MILPKLLPSILIFSAVILAQGTINTYAGNDALFADAGQLATAAHLVGPHQMAVDGSGNVYIAATGLSMVMKVAANTGLISVFAGTGLTTGGGDGGLAIGASLDYPVGLAFDPSGDLYIADSYNSNVRKVDTHGIITTVAGGHGQSGFAGDGGPATEALLNNPSAVAVAKSGNLYILDELNQRVRMVSASTGIISTIAGTGDTGFTGDNASATNATFTYPQGMAIDAIGNLYIADTANFAIRKITSGGIISTVAGTGRYGYSGDNGQATQAMLAGPRGVAVDASGNLYIADSDNERIRYVAINGIISTIAGTGTAGFSGDNSTAAAASFSNPAAIALDASGAVYVADLDNNRIRRMIPAGIVTTFAGMSTSVGDDGPSTEARVEPWAVAVDSTGNLYIADRLQQRVRKVTPSGAISTVAGTGQTGSWGDNGPAVLAALSTPNDVAVDSAGNLYIADSFNNRIRRVSASGKITTFAGTGGCCYAGTGTGGDGGLATAAILYAPGSVAADGSGNVYFTDLVQSAASPKAQAIRRVTPDGKIQTWAGGGTRAGYSGDNGPPLSAQFGSNLTIRTGPDGSLYIADQSNNRVRKVDPAGTTITTVAGDGQTSASGDGGPAASAGLAPPWSVALDAAGNLYIGFITTVRMVTPTGVIRPYAGNGQWSFSGDGGPATAASIAGASGLAADSQGNLYIVDSGNRRVRQVQSAAAPVMAFSSTYLTFTLASTSSTPVTQTFGLTNGGQGTLNWAASVTTTSGGDWLAVSPSTGSIQVSHTGNSVAVTANPSGLAPGDYYGLIEVTSPNAASPIQVVTVRLTVQTAGEDPPQIAVGGVLHGASFSLSTPVAPGTIVSIFGLNFTDSSSMLSAQGFPLPTQLGGTSVTIGGEPVPLLVVTAGQINAILPFDLAINTSLPVVVTRNNAISAPEPAGIVSSQPGVFTQTANGLGAGIVVIVHPDGSQVVAGGGNSAKAGDAVVIWCAGLGDVSPRAVAGFPATASPLAQTIDTVTATIAGVDAPVFFAGPSPGYTGLYQVNAMVPSGIAPNQHAPLVLTQGGRTSATVTLPVE